MEDLRSFKSKWLQTLTFGPTSQYVAQIENFVFGIGSTDCDTVAASSEKLADAFRNASKRFQIRFLCRCTAWVKAAEVRRTFTQIQMMFTHSKRELVVTLTRFVRKFLGNRIWFSQCVTFFRLFGAVSIAEESRDGWTFDESRAGIFRLWQLFLWLALLSRWKVKQVKSLEGRNMRFDGRLDLAIAVYWSLLGQRHCLWCIYVVVVKIACIVTHQETLLEGIETFARHANLFLCVGRRNEIHFVRRLLLSCSINDDDFRIHRGLLCIVQLYFFSVIEYPKHEPGLAKLFFSILYFCRFVLRLKLKCVQLGLLNSI